MPLRTPGHHQAAKEALATSAAVAAGRRRGRRGNMDLVAATGLGQARQSITAPAVVAAQAKRRRALLRRRVRNPPHPPRPRVAVRSHLHHRRRMRMTITVLVPRSAQNLIARVAPLRRVAAARVEAVRAVVETRRRIARAKASIAHRLARQRANLKGALPLTVDRAPQASRKTWRVVRNRRLQRVATSLSPRAAVDIVRRRRDAASTHDIIGRGLGAAVDHQVM